MTRVIARVPSALIPRLRWLLVGAAAYALWALAPGGSPALLFTGSLGTLMLRAAATVLILRVAAARAEDRSKRAWRFMGVGMALWAGGAAVVALTRLFYAAPPRLPSLPDLLTLAGGLAILSGLGFMRRPERFGRLRELLDVTILGLAVATLAWLVLVRPALMVGLADPIRVLWSGVAPAVDLVATGLIVRHLLRSQSVERAAPFGFLGMATLASAAADLGDGYRRLPGLELGGGAIEVGWVAAGVLFIVGARRVLERGRLGGGPLPRAAVRLEALLPILLTYVVVGSVALDAWASQRADWIGIGASAALSLLLMARQGVIAGQIEMRQYAALVNASADLSFISDADGEILLANPAFAAAVGRQQQAVAGTDLKSYFSDQGFQHTLETALDHGWSGEARLMDGQVPIYLSLRPVRDERRSRPLLAGTGVDLRAIKRRESELETALDEVASARRDLQQLNSELEFKVEERTSRLADTVADLARVNEELQELDRMKTEFVALVSHELRSPLTNIRSGLELVLKRGPGLGSDVEESLGLVHRETKRLSALVETIMDLSALEAGRFPLTPRALVVAETASEVIEQFPNLTQLELRLSDDLPAVEADEDGLKSVLYHLLDNAGKYAPDGRLTLEGQVRDGAVEISLTDSGPGIPEEERERIFEMFHRLDSRDAREVYGHGLGLPMVKRLIEAMGGAIRVESSSGHGARFVIRLPQAEG